MDSNARYISTRLRKGALVIEVTCQQLNDYDKVADVRDEILEAIQQVQSVPVILNLRNVQLLTSVALFPFIEIRAVAEREGRQVVLCNVAAPVAQALTVSQLIVENRSPDHHLVLTEDLSAAIEWLANGGNESPRRSRLASSVAEPV